MSEQSASGRSAIEAFLACRRIALVGLSRREGDFSRRLFLELRRRGYDVVPVNPNTQLIEGEHAWPSVGIIQPPVEGALVMTPAERSAKVVRECHQAGVRRVWLHRGVGPGAVSTEALALCREHGISVVAGECPFMHFPGTGFPHRLHGFFRRTFGRRPS